MKLSTDSGSYSNNSGYGYSAGSWAGDAVATYGETLLIGALAGVALSATITIYDSFFSKGDIVYISKLEATTMIKTTAVVAVGVLAGFVLTNFLTHKLSDVVVAELHMITFRNTKIFGTAAVVAAALAGDDDLRALIKAHNAQGPSKNGRPAATTALNAALRRPGSLARPNDIARSGSFNIAALGRRDDDVIVMDQPADDHAHGACCGSCAKSGPCASAIADRLPSNGGNIPGETTQVMLRTVAPSCGSVLNTEFAESYSMLKSTFESALANAKAHSTAKERVATAVSTGSRVTLQLNTAAGETGLQTLGVQVRITTPQTAAPGAITVQVVGKLASGGDFDTGDVLFQPDSSGTVSTVTIFPFKNINQGTYYYEALQLPPGTADDLQIFVTGLPAGGQVLVRSIQNDSVSAHAIFSN